MLCHAAAGACQIYVPVRVISIHYHDGYRSTKGNIVSFSLLLYNNCLFTSYSNLGNIVTKDTHGEESVIVRYGFICLRCMKRFSRIKMLCFFQLQPDLVILLFLGINQVKGRFLGVLRDALWSQSGTTKGASSHVSSGHGVVFSTSLRHFCVRCPFKCRLPTSLQS